MTFEEGVLLYARVCGVNGRIEAMKAANRERSDQGLAAAYGEGHFLEASQTIAEAAETAKLGAQPQREAPEGLVREVTLHKSLGGSAGNALCGAPLSADDDEGWIYLNAPAKLSKCVACSENEDQGARFVAAVVTTRPARDRVRVHLYEKITDEKPLCGGVYTPRNSAPFAGLCPGCARIAEVNELIQNGVCPVWRPWPKVAEVRK